MRRVGSFVAALAMLAGALAADVVAAQEQPNLIVIMTDDQTIESMRFMPRTLELLADEGMTFTNSFVSYPLCCPSRATFMTGQYAHNHGVRWNYDGYSVFQGATLAQRLQSVGYQTIHVGKYINGYGLHDKKEVPDGWSTWHGLVDPTTYLMYGYKVNSNGKVWSKGGQEVEKASRYQTDVLTGLALDEIRTAKQPFFMHFSVLAPHRETSSKVKRKPEDDPRPAPRHASRFKSLRAPRSESFNEADTSDKFERLATRTRFDKKQKRKIDAWYRARMRSLLAVDEAVDQILAELRARKILGRTMIMFTSDNGYFLGEHRISYGKYLPYDEGIRVPLIVTGPGIKADSVNESFVSNIDLAPTLLDAAGASYEDLDGASLLPMILDEQMPIQSRPILLETYAADDSIAALMQRLDLEEPMYVEPYQGVRTDDYMYVRYVSGHVELYDMNADPYQLESVAGQTQYAGVQATLSAMVDALLVCSGPTCRALESMLGPGLPS